MHSAPLISTVVFAFVLAFAFGVAAQRLRLPPLVGYLIAGIALGPFTPGIFADQGIANQLAEIGVILLMFGVGLHFSLDDLLSVRAIAVPGALIQALVAIPLAMGLALWLGWSYGAGLVFGIGLSIASTVVVLRMLQDRRLLDTERGKITVGWLIVQDLAMVLVLVLLPVLAGVLRGEGEAPEPAVLLEALTITFGKIAGFVIVILVVGKKLIPALLHYVAHTGSRELFRLAVLSIALGFAYGAAELFGVSLALGAFFAGMILSESRLSQQAATGLPPCATLLPCWKFSSFRSECCFQPSYRPCRAGGVGRHPFHRRRCQDHCRLRPCPLLRLWIGQRDHRFRGTRADRRVFLHPGRSRR